MKKIIAIVLILILTLSMFCSCSNNKKESDDETIEISMWKYPRFDDEEALFDEEIMAEFNKKYPNIKITTTIIPWDGGPEKVNSAIAAKTTPDILHDTSMRQSGYAAKGVLVPLNDIISANSENLPEKWQNAVSIDGNQYLASTNTAGGTAMLVNVALAKELGVYDMLPEDHASWTWDEFTAFVEKATLAGKEKGIYGVGLFAGNQSSDSNTMGWLMSGGSSILTDDFSSVALNSNEGVNALSFMSNLVEKGYAMPGASTLTDDDIIALFFSGKIVVSQYADLWMVNEAYNRAKSGEITCSMDAQYYLFPTDDGNPGLYTGYPSEGFSVFDNGDEKKIEAAKLYIDFVLNSEWEKQYVEKAGQLPTREGYDLYTEKAEVSREVTRMSGWANHYVTDWGSNLSCWSEVRTVFYPEIQAVYSKLKTPKEALDSFAENANKILASN